MFLNYTFYRTLQSNVPNWYALLFDWFCHLWIALDFLMQFCTWENRVQWWSIEIESVQFETMDRTVVFIFSLLLYIGIITDVAKCQKELIKNGRFLSLFNVVRFPNDACSGTSNDYQGVCLTSTECSTKVW